MGADTLLAAVMLAALIAYALLAGADFGGGVWDLLSAGPHGGRQRERIAHAIGPVWEANHVWLIFLVVLLFTGFPSVYAAASVALFWPLHLVLAGIVLRGASFVFRAYGTRPVAERTTWGAVFGAASAATPILLGMCLGAVSAGGIRIEAGQVTPASFVAWLAPFPVATGLLALMLCAYLAAVYLAWESEDDLRGLFRGRAVVVWWLAGIASVATLVLARAEAPALWQRLTTLPAVLLVVAGALLAPASFAALRRGRYAWARLLGAAQVVVLLAGWGAAQWPFLIYPDLTIQNSAADPATLRFVAWTLPPGLGVLIPSLAFLFSVFKGRDRVPRSRAPRSPAARS